MKKLEKKQLIVVALAFALLLLIGGTYAYFSISASNDKTGAKVTGKANNLGNPTMQIKTSKLYLNLDANLMSQANVGKTYYANENENGLALTTNPNYTLATAQLPEGDEALDCTYNYKVTATVTTPITDNSDNDVKVVVGDKTITLKELTTAGTNGIIVSGEIKNLTKENTVSIPLTSSVTNTANIQDKLVGNSYTIKIEPYNSGDKKAFSCQISQHEQTKTFAQELIDWKIMNNDSSTFIAEDGYRFLGSSDGLVNNYVCFGTTDNAECTANQDKYMYRIIGVFLDANGDNHVKLIKYTTIGSIPFDSSHQKINYYDTDLYNELNGEIFLTSSYYPYMNDNFWNNKIDNWNWNIVSTNGSEYNGPSFLKSNNLSSYYIEHYIEKYSGSSCKDYFGESSSCMPNNISEYQFKIGLMYASDYALSLGGDYYTVSTEQYQLNNSWLHSLTNGSYPADYEWVMTAAGVDYDSNDTLAWAIDKTGKFAKISMSNTTTSVRPVFYLTSDIKVSDGDGSREYPFILE